MSITDLSHLFSTSYKNLNVGKEPKSRKFYELVAAKIPEGVIRETLSQIRVDGARDPAKLFTYRMQRYALAKQKS
jgi:hypothetical protein